MPLERGVLAKVDRRVFAELDHTDGVQMVKVPLSGAVWSTWRRYCEAIGLTMGAGIARLIEHELQTVVDEAQDEVAVFGVRVDPELAAREARLTAREADLATREAHLRDREVHLRMGEERLHVLQRRTQVGGSVSPRPSEPGRNDRCPCGSGLKYKHCHGSAVR